MRWDEGRWLWWAGSPEVKLAAGGNLPNPEAYGDSKMLLSSELPLRLLPLENPRTRKANSSSYTKRIGNNAWATVREILRRSVLFTATGLSFCPLLLVRVKINSALHGPTRV